MITIMLTSDEYGEIEEKLVEIIGKIGPYKMDQMEFAWSVMENSAENAKWVHEFLRSKIVSVEEEK